MTAPRIARAGRSRFFIGLGIIILTVGFVAIFHSSQQQLDELRNMELRCEQQQESLNEQLTILQKTLKTERQEHQQLKYKLEQEAKENDEVKDKAVREANNKLASLQQHYKLLQSQHTDFTEDCTKTRAKHLKEINDLQSKTKSLQNSHNQLIKQKDKDIELWKAKYNQLENDKAQLEKRISDPTGEVARLTSQINQYMDHCSWRPESQQNVENYKRSSTAKTADISFNAQIPVSENLYRIPIKKANPSEAKSNSMFMPDVNKNKNNENKLLSDKVSFKSNTNADGGGGGKYDASARNDVNIYRKHSDNLIHSVENFQLIVDSPLNKAASSTAKSNAAGVSPDASNRKTSEANDGKFNAPNAPMPEQLRVSSTTAASKKQDENKAGKLKAPKPVPNGVVPILDETLIKSLENQGERSDNDANEANENNRYANVVDEVNKNDEKNVNEVNAVGAAPPENVKEKLGDLQNVNDNDNAAHEVNDNNDFVVVDRNHKGHFNEQANNKNVINNAAEEDMNLYENRFNLVKPNVLENHNDHQDEDDLQMINKEDGKLGNHKDNKLLNEIDGDQGKVAYPDEHLEEQLEEEDDDEYANPQARKQEPAVRN